MFSKHKGCKKARCETDEGGVNSLATKRTVQELYLHEALLGADIAAATGLKEGDKVNILGETLEVSAVLPMMGTVDDGRVFAHLHTVQRLAKLGEVVNCIEIMAFADTSPANPARRSGGGGNSASTAHHRVRCGSGLVGIW